jgi:hypothetical protein
MRVPPPRSRARTHTHARAKHGSKCAANDAHTVEVSQQPHAAAAAPHSACATTPPVYRCPAIAAALRLLLLQCLQAAAAADNPKKASNNYCRINVTIHRSFNNPHASSPTCIAPPCPATALIQERQCCAEMQSRRGAYIGWRF